MAPDTRNRLQWAIIVLLLLVIAALAFKFIVVGSVEPGQDGREVIVLEPGERAFVLREMRGFVAGVQQVTAALARDDLKAAAAAARDMGMAAAHDAPPALLAKLPLGFKTLAFGTLRSFGGTAVPLRCGHRTGLFGPRKTSAIFWQRVNRLMAACV